MKAIQSLVAIILLSFVFATTYPYSVTDDLGNTVTLDSEPMRIVTMIPSHTETVCALDACEKVVAVDDFSNFPANVNDLEKVGSAVLIVNRVFLLYSFQCNVYFQFY